MTPHVTRVRRSLPPLPEANAHGHTLEEPTGKGEKNGDTFCYLCHGYFKRMSKSGTEGKEDVSTD